MACWLFYDQKQEKSFHSPLNFPHNAIIPNIQYYLLVSKGLIVSTAQKQMGIILSHAVKQNFNTYYTTVFLCSLCFAVINIQFSEAPGLKCVCVQHVCRCW